MGSRKTKDPCNEGTRQHEGLEEQGGPEMLVNQRYVDAFREEELFRAHHRSKFRDLNLQEKVLNLIELTFTIFSDAKKF